MRAVLYAPHNDDETLFAFYQLLRHEPRVVTVLRSFKQWISQSGPTYQVREAETAEALRVASITKWEQWPFSDRDPDWDSIADRIDRTLRLEKPEVVIAPAWEMGGHEDHNALASIIAGIGGEWELVRYCTYVRGEGRTVSAHPIDGTEEEAGLKMQALLCYESQINHPHTSPWFPGGAYHRLTEFLA